LKKKYSVKKNKRVSKGKLSQKINDSEEETDEDL
jgi:hypothetical protein